MKALGLEWVMYEGRTEKSFGCVCVSGRVIVTFVSPWCDAWRPEENPPGARSCPLTVHLSRHISFCPQVSPVLYSSFVLSLHLPALHLTFLFFLQVQQPYICYAACCIGLIHIINAVMLNCCVQEKEKWDTEFCIVIQFQQPLCHHPPSYLKKTTTKKHYTTHFLNRELIQCQKKSQ